MDIKLKNTFAGVTVNRTRSTDSLFHGRNLPAFVKDYILRRFSDEEGSVDGVALKEYLDEKMPADSDNLKSRLMRGERINMTSRVVFKTNIRAGRVEFEIPDAGIVSDAFVAPALVERNEETIFDGEQWGNMTISYNPPEKQLKGYVSMTMFRPFEPYRIDLDFYRRTRSEFSIEEWIDLLIIAMGYDAAKIEDEAIKREYISRLLPFVEPRLNMIELGPKSTGKSHLYNNFSRRGWCVSGGKISRAKLFYNKSSRKFGLLKHYDVVSIDEISSFSFVDPDEMQSAFKSYLEQGKCTVDNTNFLSDCGLVLMGNILLDEERRPVDTAYYKALPVMLRESATLDRFHSFIEGWKLPRLEAGLIHEGWTIDSEYFSSILHALRTEGDYASIFDEITEHDDDADLRDLKAVRKVATAYAKLLFPHVRSVGRLTPESLERYKEAYDRYCLQPAIERRAIIRLQCHAIDPEFSEKMPKFIIKKRYETDVL